CAGLPGCRREEHSRQRRLGQKTPGNDEQRYRQQPSSHGLFTPFRRPESRPAQRAPGHSVTTMFPFLVVSLMTGSPLPSTWYQDGPRRAPKTLVDPLRVFRSRVALAGAVPICSRTSPLAVSRSIGCSRASAVTTIVPLRVLAASS